MPSQAVNERPKPRPLVFPKIEASLPMGRVQLQSHVYQTFVATVPHGVTEEQINKPEYWKHNTRKIKPGDMVEVQCEDGSWEAAYRVRFVSNREMHLAELWRKDFSEEVEEAPAADTDLEVKWIAPSKTMQWGVVNKNSGEILSSGHYPESAAHQWLRNHLANTKG